MDTRFLHFVLGATLFFNLLLASITGAIIGIYVSYNGSKDIPVVRSDSEQSIQQLIRLFESEYSTVYDLKLDGYDRISGTVDTKEGLFLEGYFNPLNAKFEGPLIVDPNWIKTVISLHRSLLIGRIGRVIMVLTTLLTSLLVIFGFLLWLKKYSSFDLFKRSFSNEPKSNLIHSHGGVIALFPILLLCVTGCLLAFEGLGWIRYLPISQELNIKINEETLYVHNLEELYFPFTGDSTEVYEVSTHSNRYELASLDLEVSTSVSKSKLEKISRLSSQVHTGSGSSMWLSILIATTLLTVYFIITGFKFSKWRWKGNLAVNSSHQLLYASENGTTTQIAYSFARQMKDIGLKVRPRSINSFKYHDGIEHIWIFASTYGDGEAPQNGRNFDKVFSTIPKDVKISFSVIGFGSKYYPNFCQFAKDLDYKLENEAWAVKKTELFLINQISKAEYNEFLVDYYSELGLDFPQKVYWPTWS